MTVRAATYRDGGLYLTCMCHERRAVRAFRAERVLSVFDLDGELHDPAQFFLERLRLPIEQGPQHRRPGQQARELAGPGMTLMVALARADGLLSDDEVAVVLDYVHERCDADGVRLGPDDLISLESYVGRMRPDSHMMERAFRALRRATAGQKRMVIRHMRAMMDLDGVHQPEEIDLMIEVTQAIGG